MKTFIKRLFNLNEDSAEVKISSNLAVASCFSRLLDNHSRTNEGSDSIGPAYRTRYLSGILVCLMFFGMSNVFAHKRVSTSQCVLPEGAVLWEGYPNAISAAQELKAKGTLPNVQGTVFLQPMINPNSDYDPAQSLVVVNNVTVPVKVLVPASYLTDCQKQYPVVYFYDGQWAFDELMSPAENYTKGEVSVDEFLANKQIQDKLAAGIGEFILVAIPNQYTSSDGNRTFRAVPAAQYVYGIPSVESVVTGQVDFLLNTVKPTIDSRYRTLSDREHTVLTGASGGGVMTGYVMFLHPEFASSFIIRSALGTNSLPGLPSSVWNADNLVNVLNSDGIKLYYQYAQDATFGLNGPIANNGFKEYAVQDLNFLLQNGFSEFDGTNFNEKFLVIVESLPGIRGDSHNFMAEGPTFIDGLLQVYGQNSLTRKDPFYVPTNPSKLKPPVILGQSNDTSVRLKLKLPKDQGFNYANKDMLFLGIREWMVFTGVKDPNTGIVDYDDGVAINAQTLINTDPALFKGSIRDPGHDLVKTTDLEWTVTGLDPNKVYYFKACARNKFSLCIDNVSNATLLKKHHKHKHFKHH